MQRHGHFHGALGHFWIACAVEHQHISGQRRAGFAFFQSHLAAQQREYLVGPLHDILAARVFFGIFRFGIALFALNSHIIIALQRRLMAGCIHAAGTQQHQRGTQRADAGFPKRHGSISQRRATGRLAPELAKI